ncbi:unnamed protein product, partial [marine sediment metagenome]
VIWPPDLRFWTNDINHYKQYPNSYNWCAHIYARSDG